MARASGKQLKPVAALRAEPRSPEGGGRFDVEAIGLFVMAVGLAAAGIVYPPGDHGWLLASFKRPVFEAVGWGAFAAPLPFFAVGGLLFARRLTGKAWRVMGGVLLMVVFALMTVAPWWPGVSGAWASRIAKTVGRALGPLEAAPFALGVSFGLELACAWPFTSLLRGLLRGFLVGLERVGRAFGVVAGGVRDATGRAKEIGALQAALRGLEADLTVLVDTYPASGEVRDWLGHAQRLTGRLSAMDAAELESAALELESAEGALREFCVDKTQVLAEDVRLEDQGTLENVTAAQRALPAAWGARGPVAQAVEDVRRAARLDLLRLQEAARREARERDATLAAIQEPLRPAAVVTGNAAHQQRLAEAHELQARAVVVIDRVGVITSWQEFARALDKDPRASARPFGRDLVGALRQQGAPALFELAEWRRRFTLLSSAPNSEPEERDSVDSTPPVLDPERHTFEGLPFHDLIPDSEAGFEAVFELNFPGGNALLGEDVAALTAGATVGVSGGAAAPVNPRPVRPRPPWEDAPRDGSEPAASGVAERLPAGAKIPAQGGMPIRVPDAGMLDASSVSSVDRAAIDRSARERAHVIDETLSHFGLRAKVKDYARGPTVTRYEVEPAPGEKISRIASLQNDLARALAVGGVRIEAPVPGKSVIGLEVPNQDREPVTFRAGVEDKSYAHGNQRLPLLLGKSIDGEMVVGDLARMPHLLIAGSTGSGKSVCVNTLIMSLIYRYLPTELRFVMIDPKMVELTPYDGIPHMVRPVVTNPTDAADVLLGCVTHMERRYKMMSRIGAKNLEQYNLKAPQLGEERLPYLIIVIDELADLMITSPKEVEAAIMRLAQMARATGMHLVLATQRPSVDILTSLIKVNIPARVAFAVSSGHDSRTILDTAGAERLTGYGDMLYYQPGLSKPVRLQGPYISEGELARITDFLRRQYFDDDFGEKYGSDFDGAPEASATSAGAQNIDFSDPLLKQAADIVVEEGYASVSRLQRRLAVGHSRAGKLIDGLEAMGIVGPHLGSKAREVLITRESLPEYFG